MPKRFSRREWERFVRARRVCVLGTIGEDGAPVLTPIWVLYEDGKFIMRTGKLSVKAANILRDPRVSLCFQDERPPYGSVTVYGNAALEPERPGLDGKMATHYLGTIAGRAYLKVAAESIQESEEVTVVVMPERVVSQDFSPDTPWYGKIWLLAKRVLPPQI